MDNRMCIYVSSPQSYKDVFDIFIVCKNKFWNDARYKLILSTNYEANYKDVQIINSNNANDSWVERSIKALSKINEKYIMLLCDDLFISKKIDSKVIEETLEFMEKNNIKFCRLKPLKSDKVIENYSYLSWVRMNTPYAINLQRGIYRKDYLISLLGNGTKTSWDIEAELLKEAQNSTSDYFDDVIACNEDIFPVIHAIDKGKWLPSAISFLKKESIRLNSSRKKMSYFKELFQNIKDKCGGILSPRSRGFIKKVLIKLGFNFTTDY